MKIESSITEKKELTITIEQSELTRILIDHLRQAGLLPDGEIGKMIETFDGNFETGNGVVYIDFKSEHTSPGQLQRGKIKPCKGSPKL